jgi:pSer/pThr/pTyr-binding forkhead associated (FHA) protein
MNALEPKLYILVVRDEAGSHAYKLEQKIYTLGRSENADIHLVCQSISRYHATLVPVTDFKGQQVYQILDGNLQTQQSSTNGTYVNNERIDAYILKNNDKIVFGTSVIGKLFYLNGYADSNAEFALECQLDRSLKIWAEEAGIFIDPEITFPDIARSQDLKSQDKTKVSNPSNLKKFSNLKQTPDQRTFSYQKAKFSNPSRYGKLGQFLLRKALISPDQLNAALSHQTSDKKKLGQLLLEQGLISQQDLEQALENQTIQLGQVLVKRNLITLEQLEYALKQQKLTKKMLGEILVLMGLVSEKQLEEALQEQFWRRGGFWFLK